MHLSEKTLAALAEVIGGGAQGDSNRDRPYRSGPALIDFFRDYGERDLYGQGFPSRYDYTIGKLRKFNGSETMRRIVSAAFDFFDSVYDPEPVAAKFDKILQRDGYRLTIEYRHSWMNGNEVVHANPYFDVRSLVPETVSPSSLVRLDDEFIRGQIAKAQSKIATGDNDGAITNAYSLVEAILKELLRQTKTPFKETEGDIRTLYRELAPAMHLDPADQTLAPNLRPILDGLKRLAGGLFELANKSSDRHARQHAPRQHHARLAVNAAFTLCEFLVESHVYQQARQPRRT